MKISKRLLRRIHSMLPPDKEDEFYCSTIEGLKEFSFGFGTLIRLKLLDPAGNLYAEFVEDGVHNQDEMVLRLMEEFQRYLHVLKPPPQPAIPEEITDIIA